MQKTRLVIIGGVAAGATAAARARRMKEAVDITLLERGPYISYANCGLPYFISGDIQNRDALLLQSPKGFDSRYRVTALVNTEAVQVDRAGHRVRVRGPEGERWLPYDKLILAQGGQPILPDLPGARAPHVFTLWTVPDMDRLDTHLKTAAPATAVIVGGGFIGLEMAEALHKRGIRTTVVEMLPTVMGIMDPDMGLRVGRELESHGIQVLTGARVRAVHDSPRTVELEDGRKLDADVVLFSVGVKPELSLAREAGLALGPSGGLAVDEFLRTSDPDIYAAGDMVEVTHRVSGRKVRIPLAGPANRQGRIAATNALGGSMRYAGALGTSVVKIMEATAAMAGLGERAAREAGFNVGVAVLHKAHHATYYPGAEELSLKLIYDRATSKLLGAQAFGRAGVDKRMDVLATALHGGMTLEDLAELDLSYAPPYSSANDPVNLAAFIGLNDVSGFSPLVTAGELLRALSGPTPPLVLDVRTPAEFKRSHLRGALNLPVDELRNRWEGVPRDRQVVVHCHSGFRGHLAVRILKEHGLHDVRNVTGGALSMRAEAGFHWEQG